MGSVSISHTVNYECVICYSDDSQGETTAALISHAATHVIFHVC